MEIEDVHVERLERVVFEGLKDVGRLLVRNSSLGGVASFALSGVHFRRQQVEVSDDDVVGNTTDESAPPTLGAGVGRGRRQASRMRRYVQSGGSVEIRSSRVSVIETDALRDTNVAHVIVRDCDVGQLAPRAFQVCRWLSRNCGLKTPTCKFSNSQHIKYL